MTIWQACLRALRFLDPSERIRYGLFVVAQILVACLDLAGVLLIGLVTAMAAALGGSEPSGATGSVPLPFGLSIDATPAAVAMVGLAAAALLATKTIVSAAVYRRLFRFLAEAQSGLAVDLATMLFQRPLTFLQQRSSQETSYALMQGVGAVTLLLLGQLCIFIGELAVILMLAGALLILDPWVTILTIAFFGLVSAGLHRYVGRTTTSRANDMVAAEIASLDFIQQSLFRYREILSSGARLVTLRQFADLRERSARASADQSFALQVPKFVLEVGLVMGGLGLAVWLLFSRPLPDAVGTLALFLAAALRIIPSLLRVQSSLLGMRAAASVGQRTLDLYRDLSTPSLLVIGETQSSPESRGGRTNDSGECLVRVGDVTFTYPGSDRPALRNVSLSVSAGETIAIVGRNGSGKSSLMDIMLGIISPDSGLARIGGLGPLQYCERFQGAVGYVPQAVVLSSSSVLENLTFGMEPCPDAEPRAWEVLESVDLAGLVRSLPDGLHTSVGELGAKLSGGQRQRLGLARALFTEPAILFMDEATSSLDARSESAIRRVLFGSGGLRTNILVAHSMSMVSEADTVVVLQEGALVGEGRPASMMAELAVLLRQDGPRHPADAPDTGFGGEPLS